MPEFYTIIAPKILFQNFFLGEARAPPNPSSPTPIFPGPQRLQMSLLLYWSATTLGGCTTFWTAGQRVDPTTESTFVWRVKSADLSSETVTQMSYTNWETGEPNFEGGHESCMDLWIGPSYTWNDIPCDYLMCAVCELEI